MNYTLNIDANMVKMFENIGVNLELMLREAGLPPRTTVLGKLSLSTDAYKGLARSMNKYIHEDFILPMSEVNDISSFIPEFFAGLCADCGHTCISRISSYKRIIAPITMDVVNHGDTTSISYNYDDGDLLPKMMLINAQISILSIVRKGTANSDIRPIRIENPYTYPDNALKYVGVKPVQSTRSNEIVFNNSDLDKHFVTENNNMFEFMETELNQRLQEIDLDNSFVATVRKALIELIPGGISDADKIAKELGVSKRTLQRKLKDEDTNFNQQLNHTRELMVRNYIDMDISLDEIAFLINYSDTKSLSRAFKVWTGKSISTYRSERVS